MIRFSWMALRRPVLYPTELRALENKVNTWAQGIVLVIEKEVPMTRRLHLPFTAGLLFVALLAARPALAGPPLLCHPYDIGSASSLPWNGPGWLESKPDYDLSHLVPDTEALLAPSMPVIVRMETLRRASLYASRDASVAGALLARLVSRAGSPSAGGRPRALALLDAAYLTEALRQVTMIGGVSGYKDQVSGIRALLAGTDGATFMRASLAAAPDDPSLEFAAALINAGTDRAAYARHAERARAGASTDALLAKNLSHLS
jgi:hypothetical protein